MACFLTCFITVQSAWSDVPASYELVSQRKGFKRYKSPRLAELLAEYAAAQEQREAALSGVLQVIYALYHRLKTRCVQLVLPDSCPWLVSSLDVCPPSGIEAGVLRPFWAFSLHFMKLL